MSEGTIGGEERGTYFLIKVPSEFSVRTLRQIRDLIEEGLSVGHTHFVYDLDGAEFIDSSGIGLIMNSYKKIVNEGGSIHIVNLSKELKNAVDTSGILNVIRLHATIDEAERELG